MRGTRIWAGLLGLQRSVVEDVVIGTEGEVVVSARPGWRDREAIEAAGFEIETWRQNSEYRFVSERADNATQKYGVTSTTLLARRRLNTPAIE